MPNIHAVPEFNNVDQINTIINQITAKHGKLGGRRIEYTDGAENQYVFKMDQLVRNVLAFATEHREVKEEVYRILSALEAKDTELKDPANIESSGWKGLKRAITKLKSRLGRLTYKRDRLIAETKQWLSGLIQQDVRNNAHSTTEAQAQEFIAKLNEFCANLNVQDLQETLEHRINQIHNNEVEELFLRKPYNFDAIEEAIQKLPETSRSRLTRENQLSTLRDQETRTLEQIENMSAFLARREWSSAQEYNPYSVNIYSWPNDGITQRIRDQAEQVLKQNEGQLNYFHTDYRSFPIILVAYNRNQNYPENISEANREFAAITELLKNNPGPDTKDLLEKSLRFYEQKSETFMDEIKAITDRVEKSESFSRTDWQALSRTLNYYREINDEQLIGKVTAVITHLDEQYHIRDELINTLSRDQYLSVFFMPSDDFEALKEKMEAMAEGPAKQDVVEKFNEYKEKRAENDLYQQALQDIRAATTLEELDNVQGVADMYKNEVDSVKAKARRRLLEELLERKEQEFNELINRDAPAAEFEEFFADKDTKQLQESELKNRFVDTKRIYEDFQMIHSFFQDPTIEIKLPLIGYYFNHRLGRLADLLNDINSPRQRDYIPTKEDMEILTEEQKQSVLGRVLRNRFNAQNIEIVNMPIEQLPLCVKCGIPVCENFAVSSQSDAYKAFANPDFQARLQRLWTGPFEKASEEDLTVIRNALASLTFEPLIEQSLKLILKMQEMDIHFSQKCPLSQQYLSNPVRFGGRLYDLNALNDPSAVKVPDLGEQVEEWIKLKRSGKTSAEKLFDSIFRLRQRAEVQIENSQYDNFFDAAKKNKQIIEDSEAVHEDVKIRALEINFTLAAMMHPVDLDSTLEEATMVQAAWVVPHLRMFTLSLKNEVGPELVNKMLNQLNTLESIIEAYSTHAELNPALFAIMTTYSEIVKKVFGSSPKLNLLLVEVTIPQWKKFSLRSHTKLVNDHVRLGQLSIDETCTLPLIKRLVRKLVQFLQAHNLQANEHEIELFERGLTNTTNQSKAFEIEANRIKRAIEQRVEMQVRQATQKVEVKQQLRMMYN